MVQAFPGPQDVVGVGRWRVRCGLPTTRPEHSDPLYTEDGEVRAGVDTAPSGDADGRANPRAYFGELILTRPKLVAVGQIVETFSP
jgi:hypothetical protein